MSETVWKKEYSKYLSGFPNELKGISPSPRCHPDTRVKIIARITPWFEGKGQQASAGVGKSAVAQTLVEYLVKLFAALAFFSRPNKRDNPHSLTIAYQ
jgi:hypothetical protein